MLTCPCQDLAANEAPAAFASVMLQADAVPLRELLHAWMFMAADANQEAQQARMSCGIAMDPEVLVWARVLQICDGKREPSATTVVNMWRYEELVLQQNLADILQQVGGIASVFVQEPDRLVWVPHRQQN